MGYVFFIQTIMIGPISTDSTMLVKQHVRMRNKI